MDPGLVIKVKQNKCMYQNDGSNSRDTKETYAEIQNLTQILDT